MLRQCISVVTGVIVALAATQGSGDTIALSSFSGATPTISGSDQLFGWEFSLSSGVNVTALGVYDWTGAGLSISHAVGIYDANTQALLTSATVPAGTAGFLDDGFRFTSLGAPVALAAGEYVIVMTMPQLNPDAQGIDASSETTNAPVTYVNSEFAYTTGSTLSFPNIPGAYAPGIFGPNFEFNMSSVPEPSTLMMSIASLAIGVAVVLRRRRRASD